jgi:hypothetical protein
MISFGPCHWQRSACGMHDLVGVITSAAEDVRSVGGWVNGRAALEFYVQFCSELVLDR